MRVISGVPFVLFSPGYALISALYPNKASINSSYRLMLSFALSISIVPLILLLLNFTSWGIKLNPVLYSMSAFTAVVSLFAWFRQRHFSKTDRFNIEVTLRMPVWKGLRKARKVDKIASIVLVLAILAAVGILIYVIKMPDMSEKYTQFYVLGINGRSTEYPTNFDLENGQVVNVRYGNLPTAPIEQSGIVTLGIVNDQGKDAMYTVTLIIDGTQVNIPFKGGMVESIGPFSLTPREIWEQTIGIVPQHIGNNQKVEILLYKDGGAEPYLDLDLWINVS